MNMSYFDFVNILKKNFSSITIFSIVIAVVTLFLSLCLIPNYYTSEISLYILMKEDLANASITFSDLSASHMLANDVAEIVYTDRTKDELAQKFGLDAVDNYDIQASVSSDSRIVKIVVKGPDPVLASKIADETSLVVSDVAIEVMDVDSVNSLDKATLSDNPSGPSRLSHFVFGFLLGSFVAIIFFVFKAVFSSYVVLSSLSNEINDLEILATIPKFRVN